MAHQWKILATLHGNEVEEARSQWRIDNNTNMEPPQLPAAEDVRKSVEQLSVNLVGPQSLGGARQDLRQPTLTRDDSELLQLGRHDVELQFQDSNLSPALSLMPVSSDMEHNLTEYSLFQQSDNEFAPLRAYPDISLASGRFHFLPLDAATQVPELSQHPLAQATILSEDGASSGSLSQHSLSPGDEGRREGVIHSRLTATTDRQEVVSRDDADSKGKDSVTLTSTLDKLVGKVVDDETFFLNKEIPAQHLMALLQKDVGMPSSSSSAVSSASETSVKSFSNFTKESGSPQVCKSDIDQNMVSREGPPGEASLPQLQTKQPDRISNPDQAQTLSPEVSNITMGSRSTQPDDSSEALHRELLSETKRPSSPEAESKNQERKSPSASTGQYLTPYPTKKAESKPSVTQTNVGGMPWTQQFSAGVERAHREQDLWSVGNQTGIDGSYLGFLPQSQSTPGVFKAPSKSSVKAKLAQLSAIESNKENSYQSSIGISSQPAVPEVDTANQCQEQQASAKVQSLPSLNYLEKVDAWRANQSSGKTSLFDSLALQGFSGISPKKKAYDAVSDTLNRILSQQVKSLQQPPVSSASNQNATQSSSTAPSGTSSPRRGEAVGSAPSDKDNTGSAATRPSVSSCGRSQSHSSLNTVVMSVKKDQQTVKPAETEKSQTQDDVQHQSSATAQPSPLMSLGRFSDVSLDKDLTLSSSQGSYNSGIKLAASIGASSVTSLEVDNYAPYWSSKPSTPPPLPRPREINIEERIPLYLHNLGIDQSPSTILNPFVPRGPIREPEFSPTDLCTIKGSIGTPTKSAQPSEGGSPQKEECSRSSILSVDSIVSVPFNLDSFAPPVSIPEHTNRASPSTSSDSEAIQSRYRVAPSAQSDKDSHSSRLQSSQQKQQGSSVTSSHKAVQLGERLESDLLFATKVRHEEKDLESPLQTSSLEPSAEDSFVSLNAMGDIRKLLSQVDKMVSTGTSAASSASPAGPRLLSDDDIFLSLRKNTSRLHDSSFSSFSATADPRDHSSLLWARSSSDSMLTSEKPRHSSVGRESLTSSWQPDYPSTQSLTTAPTAGTYERLQDSAVTRGEGSSLILSKSARRAEPEGCSAAPPDNKVQTQPPVINPLPSVSTQPVNTTPIKTIGVPEGEENTVYGGPVQSNSSSPFLEDTDHGAMSDGSSDSSLALRVAKLLQSESPATMVSSTPSITDQEESKAREWIKMKISGQQCEPLELDKEDRKRIEEIKRELLLKYPMKSQFSTDTESSTASSLRFPRGQDPPQSAETFTAPTDVSNLLSQPLQGLSTNLPDFHMQLQSPPHQSLEAQVLEIAAREGVTLPRTNPGAFTSITIATRKRSTSPSPSTSPAPPTSPAPEPLHLTELSTGAVEHTQAERSTAQKLEDKTTREPGSVSQPNSRQQTLNSQLMSGNQTRQDAVGCQFVEPPPSSQGLIREDTDIKDDNTQSSLRDDDLSLQDSSVSGAHGTEHTTSSSTSEAPTRTGHVSHVHLSLSPKATADHSLAVAAHSSRVDAVATMPRREFVPLRHSPSAASSPDEGVGLSSPPEWHESSEPKRHQGCERVDTSTLFKAPTATVRMTSTSKQSFTPRHRPQASQRPLTTESPVPVLLPYKPRGSEELFYVPQAEAGFSSTGPSDTTMESSHPGRSWSIVTYTGQHINYSCSGAGETKAEMRPQQRDRRTGAVESMSLNIFCSDDAVPPRFSSDVLGHQDPGLDRGVTIRHTEGIYSKRLKTTTFKMQEPGHRDASLTADKTSQTSQTLKPPTQVSVAFTRVPLSNNQEPLKKDQGTSPLQFPHYDKPEPSWERFQRGHVEMDDDELSQSAVPQSRVECDQRRDPDMSQSTSQQSNTSLDELWQRFCARWTVEESRPTREVSLVERLERLSRLIHSTRDANMSKLQQEAAHNQKQGGRGGATREDTGQEVREREQSLTAEARAWRVRGRANFEDEPPTARQAWTQRTPEPSDKDSRASFVSDLSHSSSQSRHLFPTDRDEAETLSTASGSMSTVDTDRLIRVFGAHRVQHLKTSSSLSKLYNTINKQRDGREQRRGRSKNPPSIIAPSETTGIDESTIAPDSASSTSISVLPPHRGPTRTLVAKKGVKLVSKGIQTGVSWFISADDLRSEARKENQEEELTWTPSTAWFEPYSRRQPWREPLRQRQVHEEQNKPSRYIVHPFEPDPDPRTKPVSPGLARVSLQEALAMRRPEFISRSTQRVKCLALQAEERKLQAIFTREREELFNQRRGPGRLPKPAGTAPLRRAVPRKEMIQRSKQIYENLPEVQRRREEERRRAEYRSYRLNAQLYNKEKQQQQRRQFNTETWSDIQCFSCSLRSRAKNTLSSNNNGFSESGQHAAVQ
ncbi:hypothetical protein INR49_002231, partial [Caranx melampygus]